METFIEHFVLGILLRTFWALYQLMQVSPSDRFKVKKTEA